MFPYLAWPNTHSGLSGCYVDGVTRGHWHYGLDLTGDHDIRACADGTVVVSQWYTAWGNTVMIRHDDLKVGDKYVYTMYAHLDSIDRRAKVGEWVPAGRQIGLMGNTGTRSEGVHLHLSVKLSANPDYVNVDDHPEQNVDPGIFLDVPEDLRETYSSASTCCHDYYVGLMRSGNGTNAVTADDDALNEPITMRVGGVLPLAGKITTSASTIGTLHHRARWITMAHCTVTDAQGNLLIDEYRFPNAAVCKIKDFRVPNRMRSFAAGAYRVIITARDEVGNQGRVVDKKVTIVEKERAATPMPAVASTPAPTVAPSVYADAETAYAALLRTDTVLDGGIPARVFAAVDLDGNGVPELLAGRLTRGDGADAAADAALTMADYSVPASGEAADENDTIVRVRDCNLYAFENGNAVLIGYLYTDPAAPWFDIVDERHVVTYERGEAGCLGRRYTSYNGKSISTQLLEEWTDTSGGAAGRYAIGGELTDRATYRAASEAYGKTAAERGVVFLDNTAEERGRALGDATQSDAEKPLELDAQRMANITAVTAFADAIGARSKTEKLTAAQICKGLEAMLFMDGDIRYVDAEHVYDKDGLLQELRFTTEQMDALVRSLTGAAMPDAGETFAQYPEEWDSGLLYGFVCEGGVYRAAATDYNVWTVVASAAPEGAGIWRVQYARRYVFNDPDAPISDEERENLYTVTLRETDGGYGFAVMPAA